MAQYFAWYTARGISSFVIPLYLYSIGIPLVEIGIALGFSGAGVLIFETVWGFVIDKIGVAKTLPAVEGLAFVTFALFPFVNTTFEAYVGSFVLGMTSPVMVVAGRTLVVGEGESSSWGAGFGVLGAAVSLGFGVGALLGGSLASSYGYGSTFYASAILSLLPYPIYSLTRTQTIEAIATGVPDPVPAAKGVGSGLDWRTLTVLSIVAVPLFMGAVFYGSIMQLVVTETPTIAASQGNAAVMVSLFAFGGVLFQPLLGSTLGRYARRFIVIGLFLNVVVFLALTQARAILEFDLLALAESFSFSMVSPLSLSLLMVRTPKRYAGRIMGVYGSAEDVGIILGPVVGAFVWANLGLQAAYLSIGLPLLAGLIFYVLAIGRRAR